MRVWDVSAVSPLGRAAQDQTADRGTVPRLHIAPLRLDLAFHHASRQRSRLWPNENRHRPKSFSYFKPNEELRDGLEYIDHHGGSSPLKLVVSGKEESRLDTDAGYQKLWGLQRALEDDKSVGTVISLPTLLAEGDRAPFSFFVSYKTMVSILEKPKYARIGKSFINDDRTESLFLIRMIEGDRTNIASKWSITCAESSATTASSQSSSAAFITWKGDCPS